MMNQTKDCEINQSLSNTDVEANYTHSKADSAHSELNEIIVEKTNYAILENFDSSNSQEINSDEDSLTSIDNQTNKLPKLVADGISCTINEAIEQLAIINKINQIRTSNEEAEIKSEDQFHNLQNSKANPKNEKNINMPNKFTRDIEYLENVLTELLIDLENCSYNSLLIKTAEYKKERNEKDLILDKARKIGLKFQKLQTDLKSEKAQAMIDYKHQTELIGKLKDEYEDLIQSNEIKFNYIDKWQSAKEWQNNYRISQKYETLAESKAEHQKKIVREVRIHEEIFTYYQEILQDYMMMLNYWQKKYKDDFQEKEYQLSSICEKKDDQSERLATLLKLFLEREAEMKSYNNMKQEKWEAEQKRMVLAKAATTIQAWWKGLMFRRKLGQYRLKKSKGKDKKGKKGKK